MQRVFVEAYEDESRPQGGHAVILIHGVDRMPENALFRLKPVDGRIVEGGLRAARAISLVPVAVRQTVDGVELVAGPDVVSDPNLLAGTPVVIEIPAVEVRGEFLWPSVAPLAQPKRRKVAGGRKGAGSAGDDPAPSGKPASSMRLSELLELPSLDGSAHKPGESSPSIEAVLAGHVDAGNPIRIDSGDPGPASTAAPGTPARVATAETALTVVGQDLPERRSALPPQAEPRDVDWQTVKAAGRSSRGRLWPALAVLAAVVAGYAGVSVLKSQMAPPREASAASPGAHAIEPPSATGTRSGSLAPDDAKPATTAAAVAAPAVSATAPVCDKPSITTDALDGGRMSIAIDAPCYKDEDISLAYGGAVLVRRLDSSGSASLVFDCFAGDASPVEVRFADGRARTVPVVAKDLARVSKVAVVWHAPVNLDLHAFEYAAEAGQRGHVHEGAPGSLAAAVKDTENGAKGRGFLSSSDDGRGSGDKLEVYTFFHRDDQIAGAVDMALDYATRGDNVSKVACGSASNAEVPFRVGILARGKLVTSEPGRIASVPCDVTLGPDLRMARNALPGLKVRR